MYKIFKVHILSTNNRTSKNVARGNDYKNHQIFM